MLFQTSVYRSLIFAVAGCLMVPWTVAVAQPTAASLLNQLQQGTPAERASAARELSAMKSLVNDATVIDALVGQLEGGSSLDKSRAAYVLGNLAHGNVGVAKKLIEVAFTPDALLRKSVIEALIRIDAPHDVTMKLWGEMIRGQNYDTVMDVIHAMADLGPRAVPRLRDALKHPEAAYWACLVASEIGKEAAAVAPELVALSKNEQPEVQLQAIVALGSTGGDAKIVVPALVDALDSDSPMAVKYASCFAISQYADNADALGAVEATFDSAEDTELKMISGWSVLKLDSANARREKTLFAIIHGLSDESARIRQLAVRAMSDLKPSKEGPSKALISAMGKALQDSDPGVIAQVMDALAAKGKASLPIISATIDDEKLLPHAVELARRLGPDAAPAVPSLVQALKRNVANPALTREIHFALGAIGAHADQCLESLKAGLASDANEIRYSACYAIGKLGKSASVLAPELKRRLESDDNFMRTAAAWALVQVGELDEELAAKAIGLLTEALEDENEFVRAESARTLGRMGSSAASATGALKRLSQDESKDVQSAAAEALKAISAQ